MAKKNYYNEVIKLLNQLNKEHPSYNIARHIFAALEEHSDPGGISNKEFSFALEKYRAELEYHFVPEDELNKIIEEGKNLEKLLNGGPYGELEED